MAIPATWLDETQVNTVPLTFTTSFSTETRIIQLTNGNLLITWRSEVGSGAAAAPGIDIVGRLFNPLGEPIGGEFRVNAFASGGNEYAADIAATANGGFAVAYQNRLGSNQSLFVDLFDAAGLHVSGKTIVENQPYLGPAFDAQITLAGENSLYITYNTYNGQASIQSVILDLATGIVSPVRSFSGFTVDAVTLSNGNIASLNNSGIGFSFPQNRQIGFGIFTAEGAAVGGSLVNPGRDQSPYDASIVALAGGGIAVAYIQSFYIKVGLAVVTGGYNHIVRTYDALGNQTGNGDFTTSQIGNEGELPSLAGLPNGNFEYVYRDPQGHLIAVDFSATAQQLGQSNFATRPLLAAIDIIEPVAVGLADGRFAVAWTTTSGGTSNIALEILDTRTAITPTTTANPPGQIGTPFDDAIILAAGSMYIAAGPGNDTLTAGATPARLVGGTGNDIYIIQTEADTIVEQAGSGTDTVRTSTAHLDIAANVEDAIFTGTGMVVIGGNGLDNRIAGGVSYDVLVGYAGNDTLDGGTGASNELIGGAGDDVYVSNAVGDTIVEYAGGGSDRVETLLPAFVLRNQVENLIYTGTAGFLGIGNDLNNVIIGGVGRDDLYGRDGNDIVTGGSGAANTLLGNIGDDVFIVAAIGDSVVEYVNEGIDRVETALSVFQMPVNIEHLVYTGVSSFIGFGNDIANVITGGAGADSLYGYGGADRLIGGAGAADTLVGGTGDDVYVIGNSVGTSIVEGLTEGYDTIETNAINYTITAANVESLRFIGTGNFVGSGNALDNVLYGANGDDKLYGFGGADLIFGGAGNDTIFGGTGAADTLFGGTGDDVYYVDVVGTSIIEGVGEGNDRVETTTSSYILPENVEHVRYIGSGNFTGTGSNGNDRIEGGGLADVLSGGFGNDVIVGKSSADILSGGAGADQFRYNGGELGIDQILDFTPGTDKIALALPSLDDAGFTRTLNLALVQGPGANAATSADATFIYDSTTGLLSYDADGSRVGLTVVLAQLAPGLTLNIGDFLFV